MSSLIVIEVQFHLWSQKGLAGKNWRYLTSWVAIGAPRGPYGSLQVPPASPRSKNLRDPELAEGPPGPPDKAEVPQWWWEVEGAQGESSTGFWLVSAVGGHREGHCLQLRQSGKIFRKLAERHFHISSHLHLVVTRERLTLKIFEFVLVSAWATKDFAFTPDCKNSQINAVKNNTFNANESGS